MLICDRIWQNKASTPIQLSDFNQLKLDNTVNYCAKIYT